MRAAVLGVALLACGAASAGGYRYGHPYYGYTHPYYAYPPPRVERELSRIRDELRGQRARSEAQSRAQEREIGLLRQQVNTRYQISAEQACYYRVVGGMEVCEDLFEGNPEELARCEALVRDRNPGC